MGLQEDPLLTVRILVWVSLEGTYIKGSVPTKLCVNATDVTRVQHIGMLLTHRNEEMILCVGSSARF